MWSALYRLVLALVLPFVALRLWWRGVRDGRYRQRRGERWGNAPDLPVNALWFHAVSAGEVIAAAPLVRLALERGAAPVIVTTMTPTGAEALERLLGDAVGHCWAPYDFRFAVTRFFDRVRPRALVLIETELWPNVIATAAERNVPVALVNARLSERSARLYGLVSGLTRRMLGRLDLIACQYADHARRFEALGAPAERLFTLGNVKFDLQVPSSRAVEELRTALGIGARRIWIAASTHAGEEQIALQAQRSLRGRFPDALLVLAPRHPERFDAVARLTDDAGMTFVRLTAGNLCGNCDVLVCDTMGRLTELYGLATVAFVGGSLVPRGGHNPIEPAALGVPVLMGPHDFNFSDVTALLERAGCLHRVGDASSLEHAVAGLFGAPDVRATESAAARRVVDANRGATERHWEELAALTGVLRGGSG